MPSLSPSRATMGDETERVGVNDALTWSGAAWKASALQQSARVATASRMMGRGAVYPRETPPRHLLSSFSLLSLISSINTQPRPFISPHQTVNY